MNFLLSISKDLYDNAILYEEEVGFTGTLGFGLQMLAIGMGAIFAVLCLIWACLAIFGKVFNKTGVKSEKKTADTVIQAPQAPVKVINQNDEIVAVIAAAIAMAEAESNGTKFTVVSFRRK